MRTIYADVALTLLALTLVTVAARGAETLTADTNAPNNSTFVIGQTVSVTFTLAGGPASKQESFSATVKNEAGTVIATLPVSFTTNSSGAGSATVTAPSSTLGYYQVSASLSDGTTMARLATRPAGFITYAVVPDPAKRMDYGDAGSRFGMQGGFSTAQGSVIPYLGVRYVLSSANGWTSLEPTSSGQFLSNRNAALAKGQQYPAKNPATDSVTYNGVAWNTYSVATISTASIPTWAGPVSGTAGTSNPQFGALNSTGLTGITNFASAYATEVAADYPNQSVHYYQVTWEPESSWDFGGTPAQLVQYYQQVYTAIHNADPKALVLGPTLFPDSTDTAQLANLWSAGLGNYLDAESMHPYGTFPVENTTYVSDIRTEVSQATSAKGRSIPFLGTEHGLNSGVVTPLQQAQGDIRQSIIVLGEGFKLDFMFYIADFWDSAPTDTTELFGVYYNLDPNVEYGTDKVGPKPAAPAFAAMTCMLDGATTQGPVSGLTGTQMGYQFQQSSGNTLLALWDYGTSSSTATVSTSVGSVKIYDWMGNLTSTVTSTGSISLTLTNSPVYVVFPPLISGSSVKINDTDSGIIYSANGWGYSSGRGYGDYQDDVHFCGGNGASMSYTFNGTGIAVVSEMASDEGHVNIQIDGGAITQVQCYNSTRLAQQIIYTNNSLSVGTHTITMTKVDGSVMLLDALIVYQVPPVSYETNDTDPAIVYSTNGWGYSSGRGYGDYKDDVHFAGGNGASMTYSFNGTGISLVSETNSDEGHVNVQIDGGAVTQINCYSATRAAQQLVYTNNSLSVGTHTITMTKVDGTVMVLDAIIVYQVPPVSYETNDTDPNITYQANQWGYSSGRGYGDYSNDVHFCGGNGAYMTYTFTGRGVSLISETNSDEGHVNVSIDGGAATQVNCNTATRAAQQIIFSNVNLTYGSHTITMTKVDGSVMVLDAIIVY